MFSFRSDLHLKVLLLALRVQIHRSYSASLSTKAQVQHQPCQVLNSRARPDRVALQRPLVARIGLRTYQSYQRRRLSSAMAPRYGGADPCGRTDLNTFLQSRWQAMMLHTCAFCVPTLPVQIPIKIPEGKTQQPKRDGSLPVTAVAQHSTPNALCSCCRHASSPSASLDSVPPGKPRGRQAGMDTGSALAYPYASPGLKCAEQALTDCMCFPPTYPCFRVCRYTHKHKRCSSLQDSPTPS